MEESAGGVQRKKREEKGGFDPVALAETIGLLQKRIKKEKLGKSARCKI